jgi:hypothetical protein
MPGAGVVEKESGKRKVSFFAAKERERESVCGGNSGRVGWCRDVDCIKAFSVLGETLGYSC